MRGTPGGRLGGALVVATGATDLADPLLFRPALTIGTVAGPRPRLEETFIWPLATLLLLVVAVVVVRLTVLVEPSYLAVVLSSVESLTVMLLRLLSSLLLAIWVFCKLF